MTVIDNILYTSIQKIKEDVKGVKAEAEKTDATWVDNIEWKLETNMPELTSDILCAYYANNTSLIFTNDGKVYSRKDNNEWNAPFEVEHKNWHAVCYGNNTFVAIASDCNYFIYSTDDGVTWNKTKSFEITNWTSICYGLNSWVKKSMFLVTGSHNYTISEDGVNWNIYDGQCGDETINDSTIANGRFCMITSEYIIQMLNPGGVISIKLDNKNNSKISYVNNMFLSVTTSGLAILSTIENVPSIRTTQMIKLDNIIDLININNVIFLLTNSDIYYTLDCLNWKKLSIKMYDKTNIESDTKLIGIYIEEEKYLNIITNKRQILKSYFTIHGYDIFKNTYIIYPINSVYMSINSSFKPGDTFGGTWESITSGIDGVYMWKRTE